MTVAVLVPWQPGCHHREAAWAYVRGRYEHRFPQWEIVEGKAEPFSRTRGILAAFAQTSADVLVVSDADVWCDGIADAVSVVEANRGWAIPHLMIRRLSPTSTDQAMADDGWSWIGYPDDIQLSNDNRQDSKPYRGHEAGTLLVVSREAFELAPPDPRFIDWGQEDDAWARALRLLVGKPHRDTHDLFHLWHPPQPRLNRIVGSTAGKALLSRYRRARTREQMLQLIEEGRHE